MKKKMLHYSFPEGVNTMYIEGKRYTRAEFKAACNRERRRSKNGRFSSIVNQS